MSDDDQLLLLQQQSWDSCDHELPNGEEDAKASMREVDPQLDRY
jgi:hypothetical protein